MQKDLMSQFVVKTRIHLDNVRISGFSTENVLAGKQTLILVRDAITSDQPEFYLYMKGISNLLADRIQATGALLSLNSTSTLLLITHNDGSADLYIQDIPITIEILAKHDVLAGEAVYQSGIADVRRIRIPGIVISPTDGVVFCFKVGWKFGLFFDLGYDRALDIDKMEYSLGDLYRHLSFEEAYAALGDTALFDKLIQSGWFPFIEVIGGEFEHLIGAHSANFNIDAEEQNLLRKFDDTRMDELGKRWWTRPCLTSRKQILEPALEAFKRKDSVSCLKIILTEIEGVIQDAHIADVGAGTSIKELLEYAAEKGTKKVVGKTSLLFPKEFLRYLSDYTFANFNPKNPQAGIMSRHSTGHGSATADAYTQMRALQAVLTLDQLSFYL